MNESAQIGPRVSRAQAAREPVAAQNPRLADGPAPRPHDLQEVAAAKRLVSPDSPNPALGVQGLVTARRTSAPLIREPYGRIASATFEFLMKPPEKSVAQYVAVLQQLATLADAPDPEATYRKFAKLRMPERDALLESLAMSDETLSTLPHPTPSEQALIQTVYARLSGALGQRVMPSIPWIILTLGASANRSTALGNTSFWVGTQLLTGQGASDYVSATNVDSSSAKDDVAFLESLDSKYELPELSVSQLRVADLPAESLNFAMVASITPEILFGGERVYGGRVNGELMRSASAQILEKLEKENAVAEMARRARQPEDAAQEAVWAIRNLLIIERGAKLLLELNEANGNSRYSPPATARLHALGNEAAAAMTGLRRTHPGRVAFAKQNVDRVFQVLDEKVAELTESSE